MISIAAKRKTTTSSEVKNRYNAKTYKRIAIQLRKDTDTDYIEFIEQIKPQYTPTEIFKIGIETIKANLKTED